MPDAARAAVLAAPVASGPFWEVVAHARSLQDVYGSSGCSGARERFEGLRRCLVPLPGCAVWVSHSPGIIVCASQSHRVAPRGQGNTSHCARTHYYLVWMPPGGEM